MMDIDTLSDRKQAIRGLPTPPKFVSQRLAQAAQDLSRAGDLAARVEVVNESLFHCITMLYQRDTDGTYANINPRTYRLLVPAPWGSRGWKRWGLRHWEAGLLRGVLMERLKDSRRRVLFDYNAHAHTWHLNLSDYRIADAALNYLEKDPVSIREWRKFSRL